MVWRSKLALLWGAAIMLLTVLASSAVALAITYGNPTAISIRTWVLWWGPSTGRPTRTFQGPSYRLPSS